jgi:TolB-like protein/DNA-binding winged helix-turn-helix (wHTH) protein
VGTDFRVGAWLVRPSLNTVSRNGASVHLEPKVMEVLVSLARQPGEAIPKDQLLKTVWPDTFVTDDVLIGSISELRRVFEDDAREPRFIQTIPKRGYRLIAPVEPANGTTGTSAVLESSRADSAARKGTRKRWLRIGVFALAALLLVALIASSGKIQRWLSAASSSSSIHSIAVLPLQNLSGDATQEYFSDGMTDALITDLAQIGSVKVISRTSSMQYKQTKKSLPEIARELNVDGIVEGTVQRSGDRVRITAQLIQGSSDKHFWANSYERDIRDVFALEGDVASEITRQVQANLSPSRTSLSGPRAVDSKVLEAYLQGNYHLNLQGRGSGDEEKKKAAEYFQQAIDADPSFALAYVGLAAAHEDLLWPTSQDVEVNRRATDKVIELDPNSSGAHVYLGERKKASWDWRGAEEEYHRAVALNPSSFDAHASLANLLLSEGRVDDSIREAEIAQSLDSTWNILSDILYAAREYDRAIELDKALLLKDPDNGYFHGGLYNYYAAQGMHKESVEEGEKALTLMGLSEEAAHVHQALAVSGFRGAMREIANVLEQLAARKELFSPVNAAAAYARLGDKDRAFYWLEQAYIHRDVQSLAVDDNLSQINVNPTFDGLHSDPRFKDLLRRMRLPP